jgi:hypothetical protein
VSFRGTASVPDIFTDAQFVHSGWRKSVKAKVRGCPGDATADESPADMVETGWRDASDPVQIHSGFKRAWQKNVKHDVMKCLKGALQDGGIDRVVFCGHSLGGSLASVAALDFHHAPGLAKGLSVDVYTFGSPRTGNDCFVQELETATAKSDGEIWRIVNDKDVIPLLPPGLSQNHFKHAGRLIHCSPNEIRDAREADTERQRRWLFVEQLDKLFYLSCWYGFAHHKMGKYIDMLVRHDTARACVVGSARKSEKEGPYVYDEAARFDAHKNLLQYVALLSSAWATLVLWYCAMPMNDECI